MAHELDPPIGHCAKIGLLVLASDHTVEHEWRLVMNRDGVAVYGARLYNSPTINPETLAAMANEIGKATSLILPGVDLDVVAYGCTSGAMTIGEDRVFELIRAERPGVACTTPITAAQAGFKTLGIERIALLTPYAESVNEMMRAYLEARGIAVPVSGSFSEESDNVAARISQRSIHDAALELGAYDDVDAVFVSCTSLQVNAVAGPAEEALGKPVLSSNLAMAWHALRLGGVDDVIPGYGRLFTH
ncbi:MAG: Asp/Glu racemase [Alphaproteobacteria bacterium]|nr:Asp/Glu racemase [Alphaproteobacteria bacterium]